MTAVSMTFAPATPRLRLTRRGRNVVTALVALPLVTVALVVGLNGGSANAGLESGPLEYVSVEAGQSLWQVAESIAPEADPRDVVAELTSLNQLESVVLIPGQQLAIPSKYDN